MKYVFHLLVTKTNSRVAEESQEHSGDTRDKIKFIDFMWNGDRIHDEDDYFRVLLCNLHSASFSFQSCKR